jgi:L-lactate dehydrogenase complex protein LldG
MRSWQVIMSGLSDVFEANARGAAAEVDRIDGSPASVRAAVERATKDSSAIVLGPGEFLPRELMDALRELPGLIPQPSDEVMSTAEVGISSAFAGVASSGSVCIAMGPPLASAASLLMPLHIVLLCAERIVKRPRDLFDPACLGGEGLRRNLVLITGPSATADMGPLVRGVHGPHRLKIFLLE